MSSLVGGLLAIRAWGSSVFLVASHTLADATCDLSMVIALAGHTDHVSRRQFAGVTVLGRMAWYAMTAGVLVEASEAWTLVVGIGSSDSIGVENAGSTDRRTRTS